MATASTCIRCQSPLDAGAHHCAGCGYPTFEATPDERARYELEQWRRAKGRSAEAERPAPNETPEIPKPGSLRSRLLERSAALPPRPDDVAAPPAVVAVEPDPTPTPVLVEPDLEPEVEPEVELGAREPLVPPVDQPIASEVIVAREQDELDPAMVRLLDDVLAPRRVVVDVGAGSGAFAIAAAARVGVGGRVLAVESSPSAALVLKHRVVERADIVEVIEARAGSASVDAASVRAIDLTATDHEAAARSIDDIVRAHGIDVVDLMRVDVGGDLVDVLAGAEALLRAPSFVGPVVVCVDLPALEARGHTLADVHAFFPSERWSESTGLRLGRVRASDPRHVRTFERR